MQCVVCGARAYSDRCFKHKVRQPLKRTALPRPTKRIKQQSDKEKDYQVWKETVARPALIVRDGNRCLCCGREAWENEKLDIEHKRGKGAHPELKRDLKNLRLYCRWPCHFNKTNNLPCHAILPA